MPEPTSRDDAFADLFSRIPSASSGTPASGAPQTRRAAREAAQDAHRPAAPARAPEHASTPAAVSGRASAGAGATPTASTATIEDLFAAEHHTHERHHARHDRDRRKSRIAAWGVLALVLLILGGVAAGVVAVWNTYEGPIRAFMGWEEPKDFEPGLAEGEVLVTIVSGDTGASISETLFDAGVTKTSDAFYSYLIGAGKNPEFHPGVYALQYKMTSEAALAAIQDPANKRDHTAQLREGLTVAQTIEVLSESLDMPMSDLEAAVADPSLYSVSAPTLEGWLFPATYTFDPGVSAEDVIRTMVERAEQSLDAAGVPLERRQEVLTIASIIQREARFEADFFKVSRVIQNRLADGMMLQMDSTAQYGYNQMHDGAVSSSAEALEDDNLWNTYVHTGLPAGPIANPGDLAIDAAMNPVEGPWLYFVTVNLDTGETLFSETYDEHERGVEQWDQWCQDNPDSGC